MKRIVYPLLFGAFGLFLLLFNLSDYLYETASLTPFYTTDVFVHDTVGRCGGLLAFASAFLQSCFAVPWLGALCLLMVLIAIPYVLKKLYPVSTRFDILYWLPSFALLLNYTQLGYMIYVLKAPAVAFMPPLGLLSALLLVWVFRLTGRMGGLTGHVLRAVWTLAVAAVGYYALGCYALFALLMSVPVAWRRGVDGVAFRPAIAHTVLVAVALLTPIVYYRAELLPLRANTIYLLGLPDYAWTDTEKGLWTPLVFSIALMAFLAVSTFFVHPTNGVKACKVPRWCSIFSLLCFLTAGYITYSRTYRDTNYTQILKMKHAADAGDWAGVLDVARRTDLSASDYIPPTRLQVLFTRLALFKTGKAADELFAYPDGDTPYNAPRTHQYLRLIGGRSLYYYYGKPNYSYRWCMEDMVEYGMRPDYLKYMLRCAVVNGEQALARKYADMLRSNPFCKDFVTTFYDAPSAAVIGELAEISKLMNYENVLDGDGGLIEVYLLNSYAMMEGGTREMVNQSLLSCLIQKDIEGFWPRFFRLLPTFEGGRIPRHYQEAALLFSRLKPGVDIDRLPIDENIRARFERLVEASTNNAQYGDEYNRSALRPSYGDTYWYYYFFMTGLKAN